VEGFISPDEIDVYFTEPNGGQGSIGAKLTPGGIEGNFHIAGRAGSLTGAAQPAPGRPKREVPDIDVPRVQRPRLAVTEQYRSLPIDESRPVCRTLRDPNRVRHMSSVKRSALRQICMSKTRISQQTFRSRLLAAAAPVLTWLPDSWGTMIREAIAQQPQPDRQVNNPATDGPSIKTQVEPSASWSNATPSSTANDELL
jgi:hypothetical protein